MKSYANTQTDKKLKALERKIKAIYKDAQTELNKNTQEYFKELQRRENELIQGLNDGSIKLLPGEDKDEYLKKWRMAQYGRGELWATKTQDAARRMTEADKLAAAYVNDTTPGIYSLNANYTGYEISEAYDGVRFDIYDEQTVRKLIEGENHVNFKGYRKLDVDDERAYNWNASRIQKILTSAIIQGKPVRKVADDFLSVMGRNENAAIRNARTAMTSAQNGGRQETYERADQMGIKIQKEWVATLDSRTRDTHQALDGQRVPYNDYFKTDSGDELLYPGDPAGSPREVYNCRCTMVAVLPQTADEHRQTYNEWLNENKSSIIKSAEAENEKVKFYQTKAPEYVAKEIQRAIDDLKKEYKIYVDGIIEERKKNEDFSDDVKTILYYEPVQNGYYAKHIIKINLNYNFSDLETENKKLKDSNWLAGDNIYEIALHEIAHVMSVQDMDRYRDIYDRQLEISGTFVNGISRYSDYSKDGNESLAEAFVKLRKGKEIPEISKKSIEKYIERWRRE